MIFGFASCNQENAEIEKPANLEIEEVEKPKEIETIVNSIRISYNSGIPDTTYSLLDFDSLQYLIPEFPQFDSSEYKMIRYYGTLDDSTDFKMMFREDDTLDHLTPLTKLIFRPFNSEEHLWEEYEYHYDSLGRLKTEVIEQVYRGYIMNNHSNLSEIYYSYGNNNRLISKKRFNLNDTANPILLRKDIFKYE